MRRAILTLMLAGALPAVFGPAATGQAVYDGYRISGPYTHANLDVFFIHGEDRLRSEKVLTLTEALAQGKAVVHETGNVGELSVENMSDCKIFIHGGDIVKGGRQDRVIVFDVIIYPGSGRLPLKSFCVEQGRWSGRGAENAAGFETSDNMVASKELKIASRVAGSQGEVWDEVDNVQKKLGYVAAASVIDSRSESSLQLTLENKEVKARTREYIEAITSELNSAGDVVGFAFAINGQINSADIYSSNELFRKLWPRLIEASAIEAFSEIGDEVSSPAPTPGDIAGWLKKSDQGKVSYETLNDNTKLKTVDSETDIVFETYIPDDNSLIHKSVIRR